MNLIKQTHELTHKTFQNQSQAYTEADIIVPDTKPDIQQILQATANVSITRKQIADDKITLECKAAITTLYLGEGGLVRSIFTHHPFTHTIDAKGSHPMADICETLAIQNVEPLLINSRKFCIKLLIGVGVELITAQELEFATDVEEKSDEPQNAMQKHIAKISANYHRRIAENEFIVREVLDVPAGKASISEVLHVDATVARHESKAAGNKVLVKGDVAITTMYLAEDESIHSMEHLLPFSEIISAIHEITDSSDVIPSFHVQDITWHAQANADGELRLFSMDVTLRASLTAEQLTTIEALGDIYSTRKELETHFASVNVTNQIERTPASVTIADLVRPEENAPEISQIHNVQARPHVTDARIEGSKIVIEGHVALGALYFATSSENPLGTLQKELPFAHTIETTSHALPENAHCDVRPKITHVSHSVNMSGELDFRAVVNLDAQVLEQREYKYLADVKEKEPDEREATQKPYCLRVYFVKQGDTAWSIAKRYRVPVEDLIERNGSEFTVGQRLILQG